jgi:Replication protein
VKHSLEELWAEQDHWRDAILAKLKGYLDTPQVRNLARCGNEKMFRHCRECSECKEFGYHCDLKFCPRCNHRITARRLKVLRKWADHITQPKHVVTTQRNFEVLTRTQIRKHQRALVNLRRSQVFKSVRGGCVSVELTNENRGWHLHAHWLLDARWIDAAELSRTWALLIGQDERAIVKVQDCRGKSYLAEVSKYVCKGSEIATWPPEEINQFLQAIHGCRFFFTFGSLFKAGKQIRAEIKSEHVPQVCDCGCSRFVWRDQTSEVCREIRQRHSKSSRRR